MQSKLLTSLATEESGVDEAPGENGNGLGVYLAHGPSHPETPKPNSYVALGLFRLSGIER